MSDVQVLTLNDGQQAAADGFFQFLFDQGRELIISGPGGVGKTFLMGHLIDEIMPRYMQTCQLMGIPPEYDSVVMTAMTNKAAEVLAVATGRPASTIHSFMNLKVQDDYSTGKSILTKTKNWIVHERKIIFIDEASMVDRDLLEKIREGTLKCKIVFVGDHCQLAPVMEELSPIYKQRLPFYVLTQPMRNNGQPRLMELCQQLRDTVETGIFKPIQPYPGVIDHLGDAEMEQEVINNFSKDDGNSRILAYTNKKVIDYNNYIRDIRQLTEPYHVGERLINNSAIQMKADMMSVEEEVTITALSDVHEMIEISEDAMLEVVRADLTNKYGGVYVNVPLPVDREHFTALVKYFQKAKNWNRYFHLKNTYPDLRPRDAATVHKAQGSTYEDVYVDLNNLSTCHNPKLAARLLYVAFTRARRRIILYGELADKYGGVRH